MSEKSLPVKFVRHRHYFSFRKGTFKERKKETDETQVSQSNLNIYS